MSTYIYLQCESHDPPLRADMTGESGQHLYDLPQLREDVAKREALVETITKAEELGMDAWPDDRFRRNTVHFLLAHAKCKVGIIDEYGRTYELVKPEEE